MIELLLLTLITNINIFDPIESCEYLEKAECIESYGCGWCNNLTIINNSIYTNGTSHCDYIGFCGIDFLNKNECTYKNVNFICTILRTCIVFIFLIYILTMSYTLLLSTSNCLHNSNISNVCKYFIRIFMIILVLSPIVVAYYFSYIVLAIVIASESILAFIFWSCYGYKVIKVYNNPKYRRLNSNDYLYESL